jgi:hypothetical protein
MLLRSTSLRTLMRVLPDASLHRLPWLLRATGAEALAIFPIEFKASPPASLPASLPGCTYLPACLPSCLAACFLIWQLVLPKHTDVPLASE